MIDIRDLMKTEKSETYSKEEFLEMKVKWFNETRGTLNLEDGIECEECKNKGMITYIKETDGRLYEYSKECSCMKRRKIFNRARKSGLGEYLNKRSNDYIATQDWQVENKKLMIEYCTKETDSETWFIALGQSGSGKTLLCSIIANHLLFNLGKAVMYITWTDFISKLKRDMMSDGTKLVSSYLEEVKNAEVLFIDELLKKYTETDLKYIIEIINYRYTNNLKTIITSERNIDNLLDIDEATFGRVIEKAQHFVINTPKDRTKNYRLRFL